MSTLRNSKLHEDGAVWIENQKIIVRNNSGKGIPPSIIPNDDITLIVDGTVYNHVTLVNSKNIIEVIIEDFVKQPSIEITLSEDEIFAYIDFKPGIKGSRKLKDQEPQNSLVIQTEEKVETFNNVTKNQIYKKLSEAGIVYGIDEKEIENILKANKEQRFIIAKGDSAIKGEDAYIEYFFDDRPLKREPADNEPDTVDYRNMFVFNCVAENDILAVKHPPQEGRNGLTVKKKPVLTELPQDINMIAGTGVTIEKDGTLAKALTSGIFKKDINDKNVLLEISPILQIDHDVDIKTGNINFDNDILIHGTVSDSMEVNSLGSIYIKGNVSFAKISAIKNITILGNVISSKIICGSIQLSGTFLSELNTIDEKLNLILQTMEELMHKAVFKVEDIKAKGIGVLLRLLLNLKFKDFPQIIFDIRVNAHKGYYGVLNTVAFEIFENLKVFLGDCSELRSIEDVLEIKAFIKSRLSRYLVEESKSSITISYALNSEISSDGDVRIIGNGCYNTKIYSKNEVSVNGKFIGGEILTGKAARLSQVGSDSGVKSVIETNDTGRISARKIYEGNIIKFGNKAHKFNFTELAIDARIVDNNIVLK